MEMSATTIDPLVQLRLVTAEDLPQLVAIAGPLFHEAYTGLMPEEDLITYVATAFTAEKMQAEWEIKENIFLLVTYGQEAAGYAKIGTRRRPERPEPEAYIELERLYLFNKFQGKKIGTALMNYSLQYARDRGYEVLWLNVWERNTGAFGFYQRWGFELVDWTIMMRGDDPQKALWMRKRLK